MAELRIGRGWNNQELETRLAQLRNAATNFPLQGPESQEGADWNRYYTGSIVGQEEPGEVVPGAGFEIAKKAISEYQFSDPGIVMGHFDPREPVDGRTMALEIKILGLHYLCGVRITATRENKTDKETSFAFRYDTLEGHMEVGSEWFTLTKRHETGAIWFRISASWRPGIFPNWWSEVGFHFLSKRYQLAWHRLAYLRLREIVGSKGANLVPIPYGHHLVHTGPEITNSDIWVLNQTSATARVHEMSKNAPD